MGRGGGDASKSRDRRSRSGKRRTTRRSASRKRSRDRDKGDKRKKSRSRERRKASVSASPPRQKEKKKEKSPPRKARSPSPELSPSPQLSDLEPSRSPSRSAPRKQRSRTPERVPPTDFGDYEPEGDGGGWYLYKKTKKWKYHPETGLYIHQKSGVYYIPKDSDPKAFRKIEDDDDPVVRKMKQSEEMRKAIQKTEFVKFDEGGNSAAQGELPANAEEAAAAIKSAGAEPKPPGEKVKEEDLRAEGKVTKWDSEKGFGFVMPFGKENDADIGKQGLFVHRKFIVGSTPHHPISLKEGGRVSFKSGITDNRACALEVLMLGPDGQPLPIHAGAQNLEEKKKSYYVTAEALGVRVHTESWPGLKKTLQDRYVQDEPMEELGVYFAVLDGHGGVQVAEHAAKQLHKNILAEFRKKAVQPASRDEKLKACIKEAFLKTDKEILELSERKKYELVGSTVVTAMLHGNPKLGTALRLVVANLGDSRAVLCRGGQAVAVSEDHKPSRIDEKKRIERIGGLVLQVRGAMRVCTSSNPNSMSKNARREFQGLAMTRSLGDLHFKKPNPLALAEPEVQIIPLSDKDLFLILATDGVWDVLGNQEVVDMAMKHWQDAEEAAKNIVRTAFKKGSEDNLTVTVIQFGWSDKNGTAFLEKRGAASLREAQMEGKITGSMFATETAVDDMNMFG